MAESILKTEEAPATISCGAAQQAMVLPRKFAHGFRVLLLGGFLDDEHAPLATFLVFAIIVRMIAQVGIVVGQVDEPPRDGDAVVSVVTAIRTLVVVGYHRRTRSNGHGSER